MCLLEYYVKINLYNELIKKPKIYCERIKKKQILDIFYAIKSNKIWFNPTLTQMGLFLNSFNNNLFKSSFSMIKSILCFF